MAALPPVRRIYIQDIMDGNGEIDPERLLYTVNLFMEASYQLFDRGLDYDVHLVTQTKELNFTTDSAYVANKIFAPISFLINMNVKPVGVELLQIFKTGTVNDPIKEAVALQWTQKDNAVQIQYISGLADNTQYTCRVRVS